MSKENSLEGYASKCYLNLIKWIMYVSFICVFLYFLLFYYSTVKITERPKDIFINKWYLIK